MSRQDLSALARVPHLARLANLVGEICIAADAVKVHRQPCKDLGGRCISLLTAIRDSYEGMEGAAAPQILEQVDPAIFRIHTRLQAWAALNKIKAFVQRDDMKQAIDSSSQDLELCFRRLGLEHPLNQNRNQVTATSTGGSGSQTQLSSPEHNHRHYSVDFGASPLLERSSPHKPSRRPATSPGRERSTTVPEMALADVDTSGRLALALQPTAYTEVGSALGTVSEAEEIRQQSRIYHGRPISGPQGARPMTVSKPLMVDYTNEVKKASGGPEFSTAFCDVYVGRLVNRTVALTFPRLLNSSPAAQRSLRKHLDTWGCLDHPNVLKVEGTAVIDGCVYLVSPWMANGTAASYMKGKPDVDCVRLLGDIAAGLKYLHRYGMVHGDLRGINVLVDDGGRACVTDFGLSRLVDEVCNPAEVPDSGNSRWLAPELFADSSSPNKASDVWSFGMLCLELLTGEPPYRNHTRERSAISDIALGTLPQRSEGVRGLTDPMWELLQRCWQKRAEARPSMRAVLSDLESLLSYHTSPRSTHANPPSPLVQSPTSDSDTSYKLLPRRSSSQLPTPSPTRLRPPPSTIDLIPNSSATLLSPTSPGPSSSISSHPNSTQSDILDFASFLSSEPPEQPTPSSASSSLSVNGMSPPPGTTKSNRFHVPKFGRAHSGSSKSPKLLKSSSRPATADAHFMSSPPPPFPSSFKSPPSSLNSGPSRPSTSRSDFSDDTSSSSRGVDSLSSPSIRSSEEYSSPKELAAALDRALRDPKPICFEKDGFVEAGTLKGLVYRLLTPEDSSGDLEFKGTFLACYRAFTTSEDVFNALESRFESEESGVQRPDGMSDVQFSLLSFLHTWLKMDLPDMGSSLLHRIKIFAISVHGSRTLETKAKQIVVLADEKIQKGDGSIRSSTRRSRHSTHQNVPKGPDIKAAALADALKLHEGGLYSRITPPDCVAHLLQLPGSDNIHAATVTNNRIVNWVKKSILRSNELDARQAVYLFFVNTADECRQKRNYSSMVAIVNALQSATITSLKLTSKENPLMAKKKQLLNDLSSLLDPTRNHKAYRQVVDEKREPCVPWLAVHLRDAHALLGRYPSVVERDSHSLISFTRYRNLIAHVRSFPQYKLPDTNAQDAELVNALIYLEHQLHSISVGAETDKLLEDRSKDLAMKEEKLREQRVPELNALGFYTGESSRSKSSNGAMVTDRSTTLGIRT